MKRTGSLKRVSQLQPSRQALSWGIPAFIISVLVLTTIAHAGTLTPSASPAASGYTIEDIFNRLTTNVSATAGNHLFAPTSTPAASFYTLTDIYSAIPTINATSVLTGTSIFGVSGTYDATSLASSTVKSGVSFGASQTGDYPSASNPLAGASALITDLSASGGNITSSNGSVEWWQSSGTRITLTLDFPALSNVCDTDTSNNSAGTLTIASSTIGVNYTHCGVAGSLLKNQFNGSDSGGSFPGGSQANGGVDDMNNLGSPAAGRYVKNWTICNSGNNYCGTGDSGADARDDSTGIIWSLPCNGSGCASFSDSSPIFYSWDSSATNNNSRTAYQLCSDHSGWSLPTHKQLMQAYVDGVYGNVEAAGTNRTYWSSTTQSADTTRAHVLSFAGGAGNPALKTNSTNMYVRCMR